MKNKLFRMLLFSSMLGYLAFVPIGPFPIYMGWYQLDHIFAFSVAFLCLPLVPPRIEKNDLWLIASVLVFLISILASTAFSSKLDQSLRALFITIGYMIITFLGPFYLYFRLPTFRKFIFMSAVVVSFVIIYLYLFHGWENKGRFSLKSVDPNMTAIGLILSAVIYLPTFFKQATRRGILCISNAFDTFSFVLIFSASLILMSRTSFISFLLATIFATISVTMLKPKHQRFKVSYVYIFGFIFFSGILVFSIIWQSEPFLNMIDKFVNIVFLETDIESSRTRLFFEAIDVWFFHLKTLCFGVGYFTTNPHNELLRALSSGGLFNLFSFIFLLSSIYFQCCCRFRKNIQYAYCQNLLFFYILFAMQFYGHTKTMWVAFMFLLANYLQERYQTYQLRRNNVLVEAHRL